MRTYVYVRSGIDRDEVRREIAGVEGIEKIYDGAQAVKLGADPRCTFLVEAKVGWYFTDEAQRPAVVESVLPSMMGKSDRYRGVHGYGPISQTILRPPFLWTGYQKKSPG